MFDPFGLNKSDDAGPGPGAPAAGHAGPAGGQAGPAQGASSPGRQPNSQLGSRQAFEAAAAEARSSKRLWIAALAVDTVLLAGFGFVLAQMVYRNAGPSKGQEPGKKMQPKKAGKAGQDVPPQPQPEPASPEPAKPPATQPVKPPASPPAKAPATQPATMLPTAGPMVPAMPGRPPVPIPAVQKPAPPAPAPTPAAAQPGAKVKAVPVDFECEARGAKEVQLKGQFLVKDGGAKPMKRGDDGVWRLTVSLFPGKYRYHCVVDGRKSLPESLEVQ